LQYTVLLKEDQRMSLNMHLLQNAVIY